MPQLDKFAFGNQLVWFFFAFFVIYSVGVRFLLPSVAKSLKVRIILLQRMERVLKPVSEESLEHSYEEVFVRLARSTFSLTGRLASKFRLNSLLGGLIYKKGRRLLRLRLIFRTYMALDAFRKRVVCRSERILKRRNERRA